MGRLDKLRFEKARQELTADLELLHMLAAASPESVTDHGALVAIATDAVSRSASEYRAAGQRLRLGGELGGEPAATEGPPMSTEDLMRLTQDDESQGT